MYRFIVLKRYKLNNVEQHIILIECR